MANNYYHDFFCQLEITKDHAYYSDISGVYVEKSPEYIAYVIKKMIASNGDYLKVLKF